MQFHFPVVEDQEAFTALCNQAHRFAYEYEFSFLWLWKDATKLSVCIEDDAAYMYDGLAQVFYAPIAQDMDRALDNLARFCQEKGLPCIIASVPADIAQNYMDDKRYIVRRMRDMDDYVYSTEKLISLSGKKLQAKRNHISQFERDYKFTFSLMGKSDIHECLELDAMWNAQRDGEDIRQERIALETAFKSWDLLNLCGAVIRIDGKVQAFTVGEIVRPDEAIIHFEKGNTEFHGIYTMINRLFCTSALSNITYVDRQEDMGLESLRKAKESYHPAFMVEKYTLIRSC